MNFSKLNFSITTKTIQLFSIAFALVLMTSCNSDDDNVFADVTVNGTLLTASPSDFTVGDTSDFNGDVDASFTGNGGSATRVFSWNNNLVTADYNADITATSDGNFQMIVRDAEETIVLDRTIQGGAEPDSFSGVTSQGVSGIWTVTIVVTNFNGDGSFSLSEGN
ncbi:hypothetical protein [Spongiivirga citrea]|uniref:Uncharacterized protein n=1 Tax=Spongiivirga citrea TaxID=1481457 RepID=A0A6M0CFS1_9FLAO|nr:hypothetical protein [Spongiivirga citrea]NER15713.1 hypothetical protein [Spongiivirga citrea]